MHSGFLVDVGSASQRAKCRECMPALRKESVMKLACPQLLQAVEQQGRGQHDLVGLWHGSRPRPPPPPQQCPCSARGQYQGRSNPPPRHCHTIELSHPSPRQERGGGVACSRVCNARTRSRLDIARWAASAIRTLSRVTHSAALRNAWRGPPSPFPAPAACILRGMAPHGMGEKRGHLK